MLRLELAEYVEHHFDRLFGGDWPSEIGVNRFELRDNLHICSLHFGSDCKVTVSFIRHDSWLIHAHGLPSKVSTRPGAIDKKINPSSFSPRAYFKMVRLRAYFEIEYGALTASPAALEMVC